MVILRYYESPLFSEQKKHDVLMKMRRIDPRAERIESEMCYHIELETSLSAEEEDTLKWVLMSLDGSGKINDNSVFSYGDSNVIEWGPRFNFSTPFSSNAVQICRSIGLDCITRIETSIRVYVGVKDNSYMDQKLADNFSAGLYDRMTQCVYKNDDLPKDSFNEKLPKDVKPWYSVPVMKNGKNALRSVNKELGLAFDDWDIDFYSELFMKKLQRDPTTVECFDLAQSNSEHSRHWFFKGKLIVNGEEYDKSLMDMVCETQNYSNPNNVIKFSDNSSAIEGFLHKKLTPTSVTEPSLMKIDHVASDIIFTAETHNMPTAVAPFSGATTGTGGRIRDVQAVGRGGHTVAGTAGYCVGCLDIPGYKQPWEDNNWKYPLNFASPLDIIIEASNGASDYGNKFGEPVISGFVISYGVQNAAGDRDEYVKPIMFSGGIGYMSHEMIKKTTPESGMLVVKLGGPVYRIGVGGGAASSVAVQGDSERSAALDFGAVQRGDAEMGNRLNRAIRGCIEGSINPIQSIHDQGAGGNGNVLKEIVEPNGAIIFTKEFQLGDPTITTLELWGAEYQESNAILCLREHRELLEAICSRERCPVSFVGKVTNDGHVKLVEDFMKNIKTHEKRTDGYPFNLNLEAVLGKMPRKTFELTNMPIKTNPLNLPSDLTVIDALSRVLRVVAVGSKRYLTNKVDRCVTGLIAQQQCVGPLHTPLADFGMIALSYFDKVGAATSIGTQPLKGLINVEAGARMSVGEALTNLVFAGITCLEDVKCSSNWMWSGKTGDEGGKLAVACKAMCGLMKKIGVAVDGGKDSLSMSAGIQNSRVKSPGTLVVSTYAPCPNITIKVEPYLREADSTLVWLPISPENYRMGGSCLAQCFKQQGDCSPDVDDPQLLKNVFNATQSLIKVGKILSGHDISDGGLITCILEMSFAGLRGFEMNLVIPDTDCLQVLFSEELGLILEVRNEDVACCQETFKKFNVNHHLIGKTLDYGMQAPILVSFNNVPVLKSSVYTLFSMWEETSYRLELLQAQPRCINEEWNGLKKRSGPKYSISFQSELTLHRSNSSIRVACIREEGTNGDREMIACLMKAEFEVFDITMNDLLNRSITLDQFRGIIFPGGFSFADTLGSARGWAATILLNPYLSDMFNNFAFTRRDTFSLGVCNGCQLMAQLGWIDPPVERTERGIPPILLNRNKSDRFECRWSCVTIRSGIGSKVWFTGMEGAQLGIWVAHGEGKFSFKNPEILELIKSNEQLCLKYVDDDGNCTETYPMNPNGSPGGIAGMCSPDGRHMAMMPHPERCFMSWQCPYPMTPKSDDVNSPWQRMFYNAHAWALKVEREEV